MNHSEDLDSEGIPDLDDALPQKELSGDAQEGLVPPRDFKQAPDDYWARDTLDQRLREEIPDRLTVEEETPRLMDPSAEEEEQGSRQVRTGDEAGGLSAEESAIHITDEPPGAVDSDRDSYTGERIP